MRITVRFFAAARERAGRASTSLELPEGATVSTALDALVAEHPTLAPLLPRLRVALDEDFVEAQAQLHEGVELALIPPVAGGAPGLFRLQPTPLVLDDVVRAVASPSRGGLVTFTGLVRNHSHGKAVTRLTYEAFTPMAEKKLASIGNEAKGRWPGVEVAIVHRVGVLTPGDLAVVIAAAAPHRKEAFLACEFALERLKEEVPIWKKELGEDGEEWVGLGP